MKRETESTHKNTLLSAVPSQAESCRLINRKEVEAMTGFSRSLIYAKLDPGSNYYDPRMPRQVVTGKRQVKWVEAEIIAYINQLIEECRK